MLRLIKTVSSAGNNSHYRAEKDSNKVVLHYLIRSKSSYTLPVTASGSTLIVGVPKKISDASGGAELAWLPAVNQWALFYGANGLTRCFVTP